MRGVGRLGLALALAMAGAVAGAPPAVAACSCAGSPDLRSRLGDADAAFVGTFKGRIDPLGSESNPSGGRLVINQFEVESVHKGSLGPAVDVDAAAEEEFCGIGATPGERVGLLLTRSGGGWRSDLCGRAEPDDLAAAAKRRLEGGSIVAALLAGAALVAVAAATALGPGRDAARNR